MKGLFALINLFLLLGGHVPPAKQDIYLPEQDTAIARVPEAEVIMVPDTVVKTASPSKTIETGKTDPAQLIAFAKTLNGIPYYYGSTDPQKGFDCSGFITYVFNHFGISVPRSSVGFADAGTEVDRFKAKPGDLILFTGTDSTIRIIGHMGIVISNEEDQPLQFIHSTSGKKYGVTITKLDRYYMGRFVKVVRVFPGL